MSHLDIKKIQIYRCVLYHPKLLDPPIGVTHLKLLHPPMHMYHNHPKLQDIHPWVSPTQNSRIFTHGSHPPKTPGYSPMGLTHPKLQDSPIGLTHPKLVDSPWVLPTQNSRIFTHGSHPPKTPGYSPTGLTHPKLQDIHPWVSPTQNSRIQPLVSPTQNSLIHPWVSPTQNSRIFTHGSHPPKTPGYSPMGLTHPKLQDSPIGLTHPKLVDPPMGLTHPKLIDPPMGPTHAHYSTPFHSKSAPRMYRGNANMALLMYSVSEAQLIFSTTNFNRT